MRSPSSRPAKNDAARRVTSEILDRLPPSNLDAEKGVIGSLLLDPLLCDDVATIVRPDDFYSSAHECLYSRILAMHNDGKRIDATLLMDRLASESELEKIGGPAYLAELLHAVPHAANAVYYAEIVRDKAGLRALIHASTEILRDCYDLSADPREMTCRAEQQVFAVHDRRLAEPVTSAGDLMVQAFCRIDARLEGKVSAGIPTGFVDLDKLTGGLHDSELVIVAARPGVGKSALVANLAEHAAIDSGIPTLFVSLEMAQLELAERMLCSRGKIDANKFRSGFLSKEDRSALVEVSAVIGRSPLFIDDNCSRNCTEIAAIARRMKRKHGLGLLIVDYLQLLQPDDPRDPRQEQVAKMSRRMKGLARELAIPVICVAQLNRQAEQGKESHRPRLSNLRESGAIEQDADVVIFVHREDYYLSREEAQTKGVAGQADLIVAKQRNGATGDIKLAWFGNQLRFENLAHDGGAPAKQPWNEFDDFNGQPVETEW